ncbi:phage tail protein [Ensifer sp. 2YAB10]|uniref:phage tail protein n=1 Tax=unclassified Ensifer TaxID=2633371 RepID=UPI003F90417A
MASSRSKADPDLHDKGIEMTEPFIGEIQLFGFNFAPYGWALCNGTLLPIQQNTPLFALIGNSYGGDGRSNFQLPNFAGRAGCGQGSGPGLTPHAIGEVFGSESVTLLSTEMPAHTHALTIYNQTDVSKRASTPSAGNSLTLPAQNTVMAAVAAKPDAQFAPSMIGPTGGNQPHENRQPFLAVNFCIALQGAFPSFP